MIKNTRMPVTVRILLTLLGMTVAVWFATGSIAWCFVALLGGSLLQEIAIAAYARR